MKTREQLRELGQFWTPDWTADLMVKYALGNGSDTIFDPSHGMGAFFVAAKKIAEEENRKIKFRGTDVDPELRTRIVSESVLKSSEINNLEIKDYIDIALERKYKSIAVNPPYIRHHRIPAEKKEQLKRIALEHLGQKLDGRAGLHVYFLILSLLSLEKEGRLSFIVSSDICEGVFSNILWDWISENYLIEAVMTFSGKATPFPGVDTNPIIFFIKNSKPKDEFLWTRVEDRDDNYLNKLISNNFQIPKKASNSVLAIKRSLKEGLQTGLTRKPQQNESKFKLGDFAYAMRGIATGNNKYFLLNYEEAKKIGIPDEYLIPAISRTRDVIGDVVDQNTFSFLIEKGRPTHLLCIEEDFDKLPSSLREYIKYGEEQGFHKTPLVSARRHWFKMEKRNPPPILFAYLGRRSSRFIRNEAGALPINGFLCIYLKPGFESKMEDLLSVINDERVLPNLFLVGKSYGSDAVKVEPRAIERFPLPEDLLKRFNLIS